MFKEYDEKTTGNNKCEIFLRALHELQNISLTFLKGNIFTKVHEDAERSMKEVNMLREDESRLGTQLGVKNKILNSRKKEIEDHEQHIDKKTKQFQQAETKLQQLDEEYEKELDRKATLENKTLENATKNTKLATEIKQQREKKKGACKSMCG